MTIRTNTPSLLDNPPIPVQAKLAAAWTSFMFLYIYVDLFNFFKPGAVDEIRGGVVFKFDISPTLLTIFLASVAIPALMVMFSMTLPARMNRATNLVVAAAALTGTCGDSSAVAVFFGDLISLLLRFSRMAGCRAGSGVFVRMVIGFSFERSGPSAGVAAGLGVH